MTQLRCTLFALLGLTLAACGEDPTIVSVNYTYGEGVAVKENSDTQVHVLITQNGKKFETTFATPTVQGEEAEVLPDGGQGTGKMAVTLPDDAFFQRYELDGFGDGEASLTAELLKGSKVLYKSVSTFDVRENGAVAAHAAFEIDPPAPAPSGSDSSGASSAPPTDAGSSDSGAETSSAPDAASSAPGDSGVTSSGDAATSGTGDAASDSGAASSTAGDATSAVSDASTDGG